MKILVLGARGMAGHMISNYLKENTDWEIIEYGRNEFNLSNNSWRESILKEELSGKIDYIINCIGMLVKKAEENPSEAIKINSLFPHQLANFSTPLKIKVIHLSSDCYSDPNPYGRSKRAGEIDYPDHLTLRTSIIGPELKEGTGLFHWFMNQEGETNGFTRHLWDGITTLRLAKTIHEIIKSYPEISGIKDIRTKDKISKYDLLNLIASNFNKQIVINPKNTEIVDKTNNFPDINSEDIRLQINELKGWMDIHPDLYKQYENK